MGSFEDVGDGQTWSATVDYGDGIGPQSLALAHDMTFVLSHSYEKPGTYRVAVAVQDNFLNRGTGILTVQVNSLRLGQFVAGSIAITGRSQDWTFVAQANRQYDVIVNPSTVGENRPPYPTINTVKVIVRDAQGSVVGESESKNANGDVVIRRLSVSVDSAYRITVQAPSNNQTASGEYVIEGFDSTPFVRPLDFHQRYVGTLKQYTSPDHYVFAASAGQQIRLKVELSSTPGVTFTLLGPNGWIGFNETAGSSDLITLPSTGNYRLIATNNGSAERAVYSLLVDEIIPATIRLGQQVTDTLEQTSAARLYRFDVTTPGPLLVRLNDTSLINHNELYLRRGEPPTRSEYDSRFGSPLAPDQSIILARAIVGTWYALVFGDVVFESTPFTFVAEQARLSILSVGPSSSSTVVDTTLTINGVGFVAGSNVSLVSETGQLYSAQQSDVDSFELITARFSAGTLPAGEYSVRVTTPENATSVQSSALRMIADGRSDFQTRLITPDSLGWHGTAQIVVEYTNSGTVPMLSPMVEFTAEVELGDPNVPNPQNGLFTLDASRVVEGFWASTYPEGLSRSIQFLASGETPGALMPGETGRVTIYYAGWQEPWYFGKAFSLKATPTYATDPTPINWAQFKTSMKPAKIPDAAWNVLFDNFRSQVGSTWGEYITSLDENAAYLARLGRKVHAMSELLSFELQQAVGFQALAVIGSTTDASVEIPGMDITIGRAFRNDIVGRNTDGPFGMGWGMIGGWLQHSSKQSDGTIVITNSSGSRRVFQPDSRAGRGYFATPGDFGRISSVNGNSLVLTEPDGSQTVFNADGQVQSILDSNGNTISVIYSAGRMTRLSHAVGDFVNIEYNAAGRIYQILDSIGRSTTFTYDAPNLHLLTATKSDGRVTRYEYTTGDGAAKEHALHAITAPNGVQQVYGYDNHGRISSASKVSGADAGLFLYDDYGTVSEVTAASTSMTTLGTPYELQIRMVGLASQLTTNEEIGLPKVMLAVRPLRLNTTAH